MSTYAHGAALVALLLSSQALSSTLPFINELHYDNAGTDVGEGIEIAGRAGFTLDGWSLLLYNGSSGTPYDELVLSGTIADQDSGFGVLFFPVALQNGGPDGIALVSAAGATRQFLSYEGSFTATAGAAAGITSVDIAVHESPDTPVGWSLQLAGAGYDYEHFLWSAAAPASFGAINPGQHFAVVPAPPTLVLLACALSGLWRRRR